MNTVMLLNFDGINFDCLTGNCQKYQIFPIKILLYGAYINYHIYTKQVKIEMLYIVSLMNVYLNVFGYRHSNTKAYSYYMVYTIYTHTTHLLTFSNNSVASLNPSGRFHLTVHTTAIQ